MPVWTIPAGVPFLDALARSLVGARDERDPLALARATILVPTRRAVPALREAFLRAGDGKPLLLPRIMPLGEIDAEDAAIGDAEEGGSGGDLPPAIGASARQILLARALLKIDGDRQLDQALGLASELGRLLDQVQTEGLDLGRLETLVPAELAVHWQRTLAVLRILAEHWPGLLAAEGAIDPAERRNRALLAQAEAWQKAPPADPVIAAGSTGSVPATAALLAVVATLPQGAVILPGLDRAIAAAEWERIRDHEPTHPQHGLARLLQHLKVDPADVPDWPGAGRPRPEAEARRALLRQALRPAETTGAWQEIAAGRVAVPPEALDGLTLIECASPEEEASTVAVLMRETLETPGATAAL
ncbi:MAG: double-strand break repair protein AddB, partial [Alphaproteobacteria bacterium]|nr:double-strand break repair protein AddB [Alphaproteobacteria bacterium]